MSVNLSEIDPMRNKYAFIFTPAIKVSILLLVLFQYKEIGQPKLKNYSNHFTINPFGF